MKWLQGDTQWWQYAAEDSRYTITKASDYDPPKYTAWFTPNGVGSWRQLCRPTTNVTVARKAASNHHEGASLKAAA
jgi:hypothetical protein